MLVPISWLKKYVSFSLPPDELAHRLEMAGTEVKGLEKIGDTWDPDKILIGQVLKVEPHPNAERLTLPTVDLGNGSAVRVVCGAPNIAAGQKVAFAHEGSRLFNPRSKRVERLRAANIRGIESAGMVCSNLELGLSEEADDILVLDDDAPIGTPLVDYLGDVVLNLDVTPNRPDCLSVLGVAREVAALLGETATEPDLSYQETGGPIEDQTRVEIRDPDLCSRYAAALVHGVKIGTSPAWMQAALNKAGMRPINNVVDVTNYVMLEYGQPLHAFDFAKLKGATIIVRAARPGETLITLDDETRSLDPPMLTIADAEDAVALAGLMGGAESEVAQDTTSILIESANFDSSNTRKTRISLGMTSEASYRFERGIRPDLVSRALRRATQLILEIAGGEVARGLIDIYPGRTEAREVPLSLDRVKQVLGVEFAPGRVKGVLNSLGFEQNDEPENGVLQLKVPYWRADIAIEEDVIEEIARIVGYDELPSKPLSTQIPHRQRQPLGDLKENLRDLLVSAGMQETISYPLVNEDTLGKVVPLAGGLTPLRVANPISQDFEYLRTSMRGSILKTLSDSRRVARAQYYRLFEIGRVYLPRERTDEGHLPYEKEVLIGLVSGRRFELSWLAQGEEMGFFDAKGVLDSMFEAQQMKITYERATDPTFAPGKTARLRLGGKTIGVVGEVAPRVLEHDDLGGSPVAMFEIDLESLLDATGQSEGEFESINRYPEAERDLALIVDADVPSAKIMSIIEDNALVLRSTPFDVYAGQQVPPGKKSVTYRLTLQSSDATLTREQIDQAVSEILSQLHRDVGAELRVGEESS